MEALKGHGTENDFVVVPDLEGRIELSVAQVRALCDRRAGIGADGVLRIVRSERHPEARQWAGRAEYFMDYRNADGSVAEMCGNGIRVVLQYLSRARLVEQDAAVATRGGIMRVRLLGTGDIVVSMGQPRILADRPVATVASHPYARPALVALELPNPHVVVAVDDGELDTLDLGVAPTITPPLPHGQNVEFVARTGARELRMRVVERGVGETRSCGTGICAAAVAVASAEGLGADGVPWRVTVPGGACTVTWTADGVDLCGPAVLVARLDIDDDWLAAADR